MTGREHAIALHEKVNHTYAGYNYGLHLDAVEAAHQEFKDELDIMFEFTPEIHDVRELTHINISQACYFHDVLEDCRETYNSLRESYNVYPAALEIVYALTNEKGRTRAERASATYYLNIRKTPGASFVKMCDRIANVRFSRMMGSSMYGKYKKENDEFMKKVDADRFPRMKECLINLFK